MRLPGLGGLSGIGKALVAQEIEKVAPGVGMMMGGAMDGGRSRRRSGVGGVKPQGDIEEFAQRLARKKFGKGHFGELDRLYGSESGWDPTADNPTSSASGIPQFLDDTWEQYGGYTSNPYKQVRKGLRYIEDRYGNPTRAWKFKEATMQDDASLAPKGLRDLARYWISKGYVGY